MELEFARDDVEPTSTLDPQKLYQFYDTMNKGVWKICVSQAPPPENDYLESEIKFYSGVCIDRDGLILTTYFNPENVNVNCWDPNEKGYYEANVVHHNIQEGLALLRVKQKKRFYHMTFSQERNFGAGRPFYSIVFPKEANSSILLTGHLAYQHDSNSGISSETAHKLCENPRTINDLVVGVWPTGLREDLTFLQIARLGASNESDDRAHANYHNRFGFKEGRGSPVFDATGHLIGLVAFQQAAFDFAIHVTELERFVNEYLSGEGLSGEGPSTQSSPSLEKRRKGKEPAHY